MAADFDRAREKADGYISEMQDAYDDLKRNLEQEISDKDNQIDELEEKVRQLESECDEWKSKWDEENEDNGSLYAKIAELESQIEHLNIDK